MVCDVPTFRSDQSLGEFLHDLHFVHQFLGLWVIMNIVNNVARGTLHMSSICGIESSLKLAASNINVDFFF